MTRKTLLLDKRIYNTITEYISRGNYIKTACLAAGISPATYCNWQLWANDYTLNPTNGNESKKIYFDFFEDVKKAEAKAEAERTKSIDEAGEKPQYWMAKAWINERKDPERWAKRLEVEVGPSKVLIALQNQARQLVSQETKELEEGYIEGESV